MSASANVRSLLRSERKARRIDHPHATYNSSGVLACQLCHISIKAESLWNQHIHGSHHRGQLQRLRAAQASKAVATANAAKSPTEQGAISSEPNRKKRKADDDEDDDEEAEDAARKRTRAATASTASIASPVAESTSGVTSPPAASKSDTVDEAEWEAFTREMATSTRTQPAASAPSALAAAATIAAAPMSAAEIAARSREEESTQARETHENEAEYEREDAAQRLEAEFDEQDQLLDRVRRLKEKREALKRVDPTEPSITAQAKPDADSAAAPKIEESDKDEDEDDEDEDEDDWAMWPK